MKLQNFDVTFQYWDDGTTLCRIQNEKKELVGEANIKKYHKDKAWDKEHLKKEILKRALQKTNLTKEQKYMIWQDYRYSTLTPRW